MTQEQLGPDASVLAPGHIHAFRHEGYRYSGQLSFTDEDAPAHGPGPKSGGAKGRSRGSQGSASPTASQSASSKHANNAEAGPEDAASSASDATTASQAAPSSPLRAMRVTREGHVYVADLDESVQVVLDALIERAENASAAPSAGSKTADAFIHSLRQWRSYRGRQGDGAAGAGGAGGRKWHKHGAMGAGTGDAASSGRHLEPEGLSPARSGSGAAGSESAGDRSGSGADGGASASGWKWWQGRRRQQAAEQAAAAAAGEGVHAQARRQLGIFDTDDRTDCPRTPTYPFTAVGQINVRDPSGNYVCSGALVGPDVVLTAAHCVFNRGSQAFYDKLDFAPGRYRTPDGTVVNPFGVVPWSYVTVYQTYSTPATPDPNVWDIAVIKLSQRIGATAGWMGVYEPCGAFAPTRYLATTAGYPSDMPSGSCKTTQCAVVQEPCTDSYLYHKCDTASGQSGSPMWMLAMTAAHKMGPYIRAVHNIEWVQETAGGKSVSYINSAVGVTPDHYRSILAWIAPSFEAVATATGGGGGATAAAVSVTPMGPALPPPPAASTTSTATTGR